MKENPDAKAIFDATTVGRILTPADRPEAEAGVQLPRHDYALCFSISDVDMQALADPERPRAARVSIHISEGTRVAFAVAQFQSGRTAHRAVVPLCTDRGLRWLEWAMKNQGVAWWFDVHDTGLSFFVKLPATFSHPPEVVAALAKVERPSQDTAMGELLDNVLGASVAGNLPPALTHVPVSEVLVGLIPDTAFPNLRGFPFDVH